MQLLPIHPDGLRTVWQSVREGLDTMPASDWIAEDVYHAIRSGESALFLAIGDAGFAGFMVLRKRNAEFSKKPILHVWLAYNAGEGDVIEAGLETIRECARNAQAEQITFGSPRKGWAKQYDLVDATYEIPMTGAPAGEA